MMAVMSRAVQEGQEGLHNEMAEFAHRSINTCTRGNSAKYRIRLMFRSGFSFVYFTSRWPFAKLNPAKTRFSTSGNEAHTPIREIKNRKKKIIKSTFAHFREI